MSSALGALVESKAYALATKGQDKQMGRSQLSPNESVETEAIQRFLSICLKQFFACSPDDSQESSSPTDSPKVSQLVLAWGTNPVKCLCLKVFLVWIYHLLERPC